MKSFFRTLFYTHNSPLFLKVNHFLSVVTFLTITALVLETVQGFEAYHSLFRVIEICATVIFTVDYLGRILGHKKPSEYVFSFFGIIDLLAIIPTYLGIGNLTFLKSLRGLRILRFLRMLRLAKIIELRNLEQSGKLESKKSQEDKLFLITLEIYVTIFWATALLSGTCIWLAEGTREVFRNIPVALLWSLKVLLGGAPQAMPETLWGEVIVIVTRFLGVILFALLINMILNPIKKYFLMSEK